MGRNIRTTERYQTYNIESEVTEIENNISPKKAPRVDVITEEVLKLLPRKAIIMLTNFINAAF